MCHIDYEMLWIESFRLFSIQEQIKNIAGTAEQQL